MKTKILTQAQKQHNVNVLHDAFVTAGIPPIAVESATIQSTFFFADAIADAAIQAVIDAYVFIAPIAALDVKAAWLNYKNAVNAATTVPQIKSALTTELGILLKELLKPEVSGLS